MLHLSKAVLDFLFAVKHLIKAHNDSRKALPRIRVKLRAWLSSTRHRPPRTIISLLLASITFNLLVAIHDLHELGEAFHAPNPKDCQSSHRPEPAATPLSEDSRLALQRLINREW